MTNEDVIKSFLHKGKAQTNKRKIYDDYYSYEGRTLVSNGDVLINYSTIIAKHLDNKLYLNVTKYSHTTSKIQTQLKNLATRQGFTIIECTEIIKKGVK